MEMEGFVNTGNACYFNTALQSLLHCPQLTNYFLQHIHHEDLNNRRKKGTAFVEAYEQLVLAYWTKEGDLKKALGSVRAAFMAAHKSFANSEQHDAHEAFLAMLQSLHAGLTKTKPIAGSKAVPVLDAPARTAWHKNNTKNYSILSEIFQGQFRVAVSSDEYSSVAYDHGFDVQLPVASDIEAAIAASWGVPEGPLPYTTEEKHKVRVMRTQTPTYLPLILVVHIKRFTSKAKLDSFVDYPLDLDLSRYTGRPNDTYALFGVMLHSGNLDSGHYTVFLKSGDSWLHFNDASVRHVKSLDEIIHRDAYVLLYKKIKP
jgi:ubiquitin C-terminal hydrolase